MPTDTGKTTILALSVSAGAGHVRAAQALQAAAARYRPEVEVVHVDVMELVSKLFRKAYADSYLKVVERHPALWGYLYDRADTEKVDSALNRLRIEVERLNLQKVKKTIREVHPDHIVCTHFLPAQMLSGEVAKGKLTTPVWVQTTDYDIHSLWIHMGMAGYFAATDEVASRIAERGVPASTVHTTGIPIMPVFGEKLSRADCARDLGLDPGKMTIALMSGGHGVGGIDALVERLMELPGDFQMVALAGRNEGLLGRLKALAAQRPGRLVPMGFTDKVERVMAASDIAVTKPGGLTTTECLAVGLPMIIVSPIPGQEERNADFLLENGAALKACDSSALIYRVRALLAEPARLESLRANAKRLGRPGAARAVLDTVTGK